MKFLVHITRDEDVFKARIDAKEKERQRSTYPTSLCKLIAEQGTSALSRGDKRTTRDRKFWRVIIKHTPMARGTQKKMN